MSGYQIDILQPVVGHAGWATGIMRAIPPDEHVVALVRSQAIVAVASREMLAGGWTIRCFRDVSLALLAALVSRAAAVSDEPIRRPIVSRRTGRAAKPRKRLRSAVADES